MLNQREALSFCWLLVNLLLSWGIGSSIPRERNLLLLVVTFLFFYFGLVSIGLVWIRGGVMLIILDRRGGRVKIVDAPAEVSPFRPACCRRDFIRSGWCGWMGIVLS